MTILLLDTNIVSYLMKGHPLAAGYVPHLSGKRLAVSFMTVAELHEGARRANWGAAGKARVGDRTICGNPFFSGHLPALGDVRYARRTQPISHEDACMAATALELSLALVTHNSTDFAGIPGLNVISTYVP